MTDAIYYKEDTVFVGGLPHNAHRDDVMVRFQEFGSIKKIVWPMVWDEKLRCKRPKGFAYVVFHEKEPLQAVLKMHEEEGIYLAGFPESKLGIDRKRDNSKLTTQVRARRAKMGLPAHDDKDKQHETETYVGEDGQKYIKAMIFLGSIPTKATRDEIEAMFSQYGHIKKIVWPQTIDKVTGVRRHKGFAYVIFFAHADMQKCLEAAKTNGGQLEMHGEMMAVQPKLSSDDKRTPAPACAPRDWEAMYRAEKAKNDRLLSVLREQRMEIRRLGGNYSPRMSGSRSPVRSVLRSGTPRTPVSTGSQGSPGRFAYANLHKRNVTDLRSASTGAFSFLNRTEMSG